MSRTLRISVPVPAQVQREIRSLCAENGRSAASNLADLIVAGLDKTNLDARFFEQKADLETRFSELKSVLEDASPNAGNNVAVVAEVKKTLAAFLAEMRSSAPKAGPASGGEVVFLPEKAAALLFEEALFSSHLSREVLLGSQPGAQQKPAGQLIASARQKARDGLVTIVQACQEGV